MSSKSKKQQKHIHHGTTSVHRTGATPTDYLRLFQQLNETTRLADNQTLTEKLGLTPIQAKEVGLHLTTRYMERELWGTILTELVNAEGNQHRRVQRMKEAFESLKREIDLCCTPSINLAISRAKELKKEAEELNGTVDPEFYRNWNEIITQTLELNATMRKKGVCSAMIRTDFETKIRKALDPKNREKLLRVNQVTTISQLNGLVAYHDPETLGEIKAAMESFFRKTEEFKKEELASAQLACFKAICYALAIRNLCETKLSRRGDTNLDIIVMTAEIDSCPYIILHDDETLDKIASIAKKVQSTEVAGAISRNKQWVRYFGLNSVETIITELDGCKRTREVLEIIDGSNAEAAIKTIRKLRTRPDLLDFYKGIADPRDPRIKKQFIEYLDFEDQPVGEKTFHQTICEFLETITPEQIMKEWTLYLVRGAASTYASGAWDDIYKLLMDGNEGIEKANNVFEKIFSGELDNARTMAAELIGKIEEARSEARGELITRMIKFDYPQIEDEDLAVLEPKYRKTLNLGISRFSLMELRKMGLTTVISMMNELDRLDDKVFAAILSDPPARNLFANIARKLIDDELIEKLNKRVGNSAERDQELEELQQQIYFDLQEYHERRKLLEKQKTTRIILIAGEKTAATIRDGLGVLVPDKKVIIVTKDPVPRQYLGQLIGAGDIVVIETSHLSHSTSNNAVAICTARDTPFVLTSQTNAEAIARKIGAANEK